MVPLEEVSSTRRTPDSTMGSRVKAAHCPAAAPESRAATGDYGSESRIPLDIERRIYEANDLRNVAAAIRRGAKT
jgi:hypothetical protein